MKILAIDSSGLAASAAVVEDDLLKCEFTVNNKLTHSETLLPMIREMLALSGQTLQEIHAVAVAAGPGSFTGLRIGAATAKGQALALDCPMISVSSLEAMAYSVSLMSDACLCPVMDARRGQVYAAAYRHGACVIPEAAVGLGLFLEQLSALPDTEDTEFIFLGDGVPVHAEAITAGLDRDVSFAGPAHNRQRGAAVAELGACLYQKWLGRNGLTAELVKEIGADQIKCFDDIVMNSDSFVPHYLRQTQAERELAEGLLEDAGLHSLKKLREHAGSRNGHAHH